MSNFTDERDVIIAKIKSLFTSAEDAVVAFFKPLIPAFESEGKTILIDAAKNAVVVGEATPGVGTIKMEAALAAFAATVASEGLPYVENEARLLIEVALHNFRSEANAAIPQTEGEAAVEVKADLAAAGIGTQADTNATGTN